MKNAQDLLKLFLIFALNSSCASFGMGQGRQCTPPSLPPRPRAVVCIANDNGTAQCFNPATDTWDVKPIKNYVCLSPTDYNRDEEWIDAILESVGNGI